jgi:hypothetical protein
MAICDRLGADCLTDNCFINGDCCSVDSFPRQPGHQRTYQNF